jgi:hypothetical protein
VPADHNSESNPHLDCGGHQPRGAKRLYVPERSFAERIFLARCIPNRCISLPVSSWWEPAAHLARWIVHRIVVVHGKNRRTSGGLGVEQCFATTQPAVRDELRSSRNGRRETANERRQNCVQLWNCPTQAKGRLGWATRHASHPSTSAMGGAAFSWCLYKGPRLCQLSHSPASS